jgi:hypothetical protein
MKLIVSIAVVALYTLVPFFAGSPPSTPAFFLQTVGGVPLSALFVVVLLLAFPTIAWLLASRLGAGKDGE